nr:hypothetical protein [Tanacetum cinerariifolium]
EQAFWSRYSVQSEEPNLSLSTTIVEVPKELPKVSMVNSSLKKLKFHLASFDMVVKERTTAKAMTEGTWGFEHTKACFRDEIILFVKALKELFNSFDQFLINELTEVQNVFNQMEHAVEQHCVEKNKFQDKIKNILKDNERLLEQAISVDIVNIVVHDHVKSADKTVNVVEVPKELPKVSMVNSCLKKLKFRLASFDIVVKERTTAIAITEGTWGFEHTKACFRDDIIPFVKTLKELFTSFDQCLIDEVTEVQNIFKQMELDVEQYCAEKTKFQTKMENVLKENDRLLTQALTVEIVNIVVHDYVNVDCLNVDACVHRVTTESELKPDFIKKECYEKFLQQYHILETYVDVAPLVPKLRKNWIAHIDYIRHTQEEAATLREIVESERLLSPLNTSLAYACKYTRRIQELLMILQQTCPSITDLRTNPVAVTSKNKTKQIRRTA